jgi:hydrogenase expression/formation protein HypD
MKYLDEFRNSEISKYLIEKIHRTVTRNWNIMEICGGQTHTIMKYGIDKLLPKGIQMIHGPGCPVCVTPLEVVDKAIEIAKKPNVIFTSFGDMMRVPGSHSDLLKAKSQGADVRMVYSPLEALKLAQQNPEKEIVFFAIGFETTAPANAMALKQAHRLEVNNFSELVSQVLVPPAMEAILSSPNNLVNGFLAAGHVCSIMGYWQYEPIAEKYKIPIVPTGFEPVDMLEGIYLTLDLLEKGVYKVENQYRRVVKKEGNIEAQKMLEEIFEVTDMKWRGIGVIPQSGYRIREKYKDYDANLKYEVGYIDTEESSKCISGEVLQGLKKPNECPAFGTECNPQNPLGATMVSSEGACAAYYQYHKRRVVSEQ